MTDDASARTGPELPGALPYGEALVAVRALLQHELLHSDALASGMTEYLASSAGKNFRAQLLLAAAAGEDGMVPHDALLAAAALELLHLATLVHDDVVDGSDMRRGRPSLRSKFGEKSAVICGDYLMCRCFLLLTGLSGEYRAQVTEVARAMMRVCLGELREYRHNGDYSLSPLGYFRIIAGKTAALFAFSLYAGGVTGGLSEREERALGWLGYYIGMAFQLVDDGMDYAADTETAGKSVQHDLAEGVVTLPLIVAMRKDPALHSRLADSGLAEGIVRSPSELAQVLAEVRALGGAGAARETAEKYFAKAEKQLGRVQNAARRERLAALMRAIRERTY